MREPTEFLEAFGRRVRERRLSKCLSLDRLAAAMDMSKAGLWQIEHGVSEAGIGTLLRLCGALGVDANFLMGT